MAQNDSRSPRYDDAFGIATHNSYWINRGDDADTDASGTQELVLDQLLHDHVRALEIDVHSEATAPGQWRVYHTSGARDFLGRYLDDYLEYLRDFHYALPQHDVINIIIELKNVGPKGGFTVPVPFAESNNNFDASHTIEQFDSTFRRYLGPWLYTPSDFFARSQGAATLTDCARDAGWPKIAELRGKFIVNILGNWSTAAYDWVTYATTDIHNRLAFPMQSVLEVDLPVIVTGGGWGGAPSVPVLFFATSVDGTEVFIKSGADNRFPCQEIDASSQRAAFADSVFWQLEDFSNLAMQIAHTFLMRGGIIRSHDAFDYPDQIDVLQRGIQFVQTDHPWHVLNDDAPVGSGIPTDPSRRLRDKEAWLHEPPGVRPGLYREMGARLYGHTDGKLWAYSLVPPTSQRWWETTVSSTRRGDNSGSGPMSTPEPVFPRRAWDRGLGGIRVESGDGRDTLILSRTKDSNWGSDPYQEAVIISVLATQNGQSLVSEHYPAARYGPVKRLEDENSGDVVEKCIGSLIALAVDNQGDRSLVRAYSAGRLTAAGKPDWQVLGRWGFEQPLIKQGFTVSQDALFAGARFTDALTNDMTPASWLRFVTLEELPERQIDPPNFPHTVSVFADLSCLADGMASSAISPEGDLNVCKLDEHGTLAHTIRRGDDGVWPKPFADVQNEARKNGPNIGIGPICNVACACDVQGNLHILAIDEQDGLWHTIRDPNGTWPYAFGDVQNETRKVGPNDGIGPVRNVACACDVQGNLHILAIDEQDGLWHTIRDPNGAWPYAFGDVQNETRKVGPNDGIGPVRNVACACDAQGNLHILAIDEQDGLWHTLRDANGTWPYAFGDVLATAGQA